MFKKFLTLALALVIEVVLIAMTHLAKQANGTDNASTSANPAGV